MSDIYLSLIVGLVLGLALGWIGCTLVMRARLSAQLAVAHAQRDMLQAQVNDLVQAQETRADTRAMLAPLASALHSVGQQVAQLERDRVEHFGMLGEQLRDVATSTDAVRNSVIPLTNALHATHARGAWGETQLRRVVEHAGMIPHCDFTTQHTSTNQQGNVVRPDLVVHLPAERSLVVDAKAPMAAFLQASAIDLTHQQRQTLLAAHAKAVRTHITALAAKQYWTALPTTPEFVVCFLPADSMLATALDTDPALYDDALAKHVILATPSTLLAILRTAAVSWRHDSISQHANDVLALGKELYARLTTVNTHLTSLGSAMQRSVDHYNKLVGSIETRVLVTARKMHELNLADAPLTAAPVIDATPRHLTSYEMLQPDECTPEEPRVYAHQDEPRQHTAEAHAVVT